MDFKYNVQTVLADNRIELKGFDNHKEAIDYWQSKKHSGLRSWCYSTDISLNELLTIIKSSPQKNVKEFVKETIFQYGYSLLEYNDQCTMQQLAIRLKTYECRTAVSHKHDFKTKPDFKLKAKNYRDAAIKASVKFAKKFNVLYQSGLIIYVTDSPLVKPCIVHSYDILVNKSN